MIKVYHSHYGYETIVDLKAYASDQKVLWQDIFTFRVGIVKTNFVQIDIYQTEDQILHLEINLNDKCIWSGKINEPVNTTEAELERYKQRCYYVTRKNRNLKTTVKSLYKCYMAKLAEFGHLIPENARLAKENIELRYKDGKKE